MMRQQSAGLGEIITKSTPAADDLATDSPEDSASATSINEHHIR